MSAGPATRAGNLVAQCCPTCGQNMSVTRYFVVHHRGSAWRVPVRDVVALESRKKYTRLYVSRRLEGAPAELLLDRPVVQICAELPGEFLRIRRDWAVRATHATAIRPGENGTAVMTVASVGDVPVGRRYRVMVRDALDLRA